MRRFLAVLAAPVLAACVAAPSGPTGSVEVSFRDPEKFADMRVRRLQMPRERAGLLADLRRFLEVEARPMVPAGAKLEVTVTEIDMAGDFGSLGMQSVDMRIVGDGSPPRVDLEFVLTGADGQVVRRGRRELRDPAFLLRPNITSDLLRFEKALLGDWLDREFAPPR